MPFTGKATYSAGATLPELAEDVSDLIAILSPYETPLLDALGDPVRDAASTRHEWIEDDLLPNKDTISDGSITNPLTEAAFDVANGGRFRIGDQIQAQSSRELMLVTNVAGNTLTVTRAYAGTTAEAISNGLTIRILGNAALEGSDRPATRFTNRARKANYTQIFTASVEVSGSDLAAGHLGLADEMDFQKQQRLRELVRDLENTVINGGIAGVDPQGSATVRRTMKGIIRHLASNVFSVGDSGFPSGTDLDEAKVNYALRKIWENSNGNIDLIVVGGNQKRRFNQFLAGMRNYASSETTFYDRIDAYQSDFGVCRIVTTRWMPLDMALLLDSSRIAVLPMAGRSFQYKPLASSGDYECGELIGEYTLELRNEAAHGLIRGLSVS